MAKPKKQLFILIDQSIKGPGGHHFEYAERILNSAQGRGYETLLLAHEAYAGTKHSAHPVRAVFSRTFWENFEAASEAKPPSRIRSAISRWRAGWRDRMRSATIRAIYTPLGYYPLWAWEKVHGSAAGAKSKIVLPPHRNTFLASGARAALRLIELSRSQRFAYPRRILSRAVRTIAVGLLVLAGVIASPFYAIWRLFGAMTSPKPPAASLFERELAAGLSGLDPNQIAYIFVPTLHTIELQGICGFLERRRSFRRTRWGLLYRRNIFQGYPDQYAGQIESVRQFKYELEQCRLALGTKTLEFFTDTDELTAQYNALRIFEFNTLPVPSDFTVGLRASRRGGLPAHRELTATYLGDARDEKGYARVLDVQKALLASHIEPGRLRLLLQSNYNIPSGEPATVAAHRLLRDSNSEGVELIYGPFDRRDYQSHIAATDVMLVPYSQGNYAARSSGVFAEAVAAGIPAVVPSGTWMANIIEPFRQRYLSSVFTVECPLGDGFSLLDTAQLPFERLLKGLLIELPRGCTHAVLRVGVDCQSGSMIAFKGVAIDASGVPLSRDDQLVKMGGNVTRILFHQHGAAKAWLKIALRSSSPITAPCRVDLDCFRAPPTTPTSVGSVIFGQSETGLVDAVREVVDCYEHYEATALAFAEQCRSLYDPETLLNRLILRSTDDLERVHNGVAPSHA